jgi:hypothetical protein
VSPSAFAACSPHQHPIIAPPSHRVILHSAECAVRLGWPEVSRPAANADGKWAGKAWLGKIGERFIANAGYVLELYERYQADPCRLTRRRARTSSVASIETLAQCAGRRPSVGRRSCPSAERCGGGAGRLPVSPPATTARSAIRHPRRLRLRHRPLHAPIAWRRSTQRGWRVTSAIQPPAADIDPLGCATRRSIKSGDAASPTP